MAFETLADNVARVREEVAAVQVREGLSGSVRLVAVTKGHPAQAAEAALAAGVVDLGENRVQEAVRKVDALADLPARWHLIGHLQTNKARDVPGRFVMVHSVDSDRVVEALARASAAQRLDHALDVLVQVNVAGEEQKSGCRPADVERVCAAVVGTAHVRLRGLMTMAPFTDDERVQRRVFAGLRALRDTLERKGYELPELSMGMSGDYRAAVAEGATLLRLGTVLFGERAT